jgi:hypothetical protein
MIPEVGSEWKARDGRLMRVIRIVDAGIQQDCPRAVLSVLNPGYRMRGFTEIATSNFGHQPPAFLIPARSTAPTSDEAAA